MSNGDELVGVLAGFGNVVKFVPSKHSLRKDINVFQNAKLVVGVHGAGFANMMFCSPNTLIFEIGYTTGMKFPAIYYSMAEALQLKYWVTVGKGDYSGTIEAPLVEISTVLAQIVR